VGKIKKIETYSGISRFDCDRHSERTVPMPHEKIEQPKQKLGRKRKQLRKKRNRKGIVPIGEDDCKGKNKRVPVPSHCVSAHRSPDALGVGSGDLG